MTFLLLDYKFRVWHQFWYYQRMGISPPMLIAAIIFLALGASSFVWSFVAYARASWYLNSDLMGASLAFTSLWIFGSVLTLGGLLVLNVIPLRFSPFLITAGLVVSFIAGKLTEFFAVERAVRLFASGYRTKLLKDGIEVPVGSTISGSRIKKSSASHI